MAATRIAKTDHKAIQTCLNCTLDQCNEENPLCPFFKPHRLSPAQKRTLAALKAKGRSATIDELLDEGILKMRTAESTLERLLDWGSIEVDGQVVRLKETA